MPKRVLQGTVVSDKQAKTVVVRVERRFTHPVLKKTVRRSKHYHAHDEANDLNVGEQKALANHVRSAKTDREAQEIVERELAAVDEILAQIQLGEIKDLKSQGLENADAADLGEYVASRQSPSMAAFRFRSGDAKAPRSLSVDVARYAQQAVLMANIEEARYRVLLSKEGKTLVQALYAIRNNQRNFLKVTLPQGA